MATGLADQAKLTDYHRSVLTKPSDNVSYLYLRLCNLANFQPVLGPLPERVCSCSYQYYQCVYLQSRHGCKNRRRYNGPLILLSDLAEVGAKGGLNHIIQVTLIRGRFTSPVTSHSTSPSRQGLITGNSGGNRLF